MQDCIFCKIISGDIPSEKIYEDDAVVCFLDINPVSAGHSLVVPKQHFQDVLDTPQELLGNMLGAIQKIAPAIKLAVGAAAFTVGMNNGKAAGQIIFHTHMHIIPRFDDDGLVHWPHTKGDPDALAKLGETIRNHLNL